MAADPHASARHALRLAGNDALTMAAKIEKTAAAVLDLWGPAGLERLANGASPHTEWAADKRRLAAELFASADALVSKEVTHAD